MNYDFVVLGADGIQGRIASRDLLESGYSVLLCALDKFRIEDILSKYKNAEYEHVNLKNVKHAAEVIKKSKADVVLNCALSDWNMNAMKACIDAGANVLDLGSPPKITMRQLEMHNSLKRKNLMSITGCGAAPGVVSIMLRYIEPRFKEIHTVNSGYAWTSNMNKFVVPFSIEAIIDEFTDKAVYLNNGKFVKGKPFSNFINREFNFVGKQKMCMVKHPEPFTFYKFLKHKRLKNVKFFAGFPDHSFDKFSTMIELGLGSWKTVRFNGYSITPVEFLSIVLKELEIPQGYKEIENLWVDVHANGKTSQMECIAPTLKGWEDATCNIDTGMPASIMAQMVKEEIIKEKGSFSPEFVVPPEPFFEELAKRKMYVYEDGEKIN